jgi:tetratricopeptide (TPR) repeat protein
MNLSAWQSSRRLVPRWRSYAATLKSGELATPMSKALGPTPFDPMHRLELFRLSPSLVTAAEAVETAIVSGREGDAVDAARRIVDIDANAAPLIREQAAALLRRAGQGGDAPTDVRAKTKPDAAVWRRLTRLHPEDPISWVELALEQTIRGHGPAATRSMTMALHLAPNNRHVVRSASRLHLHLGDPERAHDIVARNAATSTDPWLMAAEIALANVAERSPRFFKSGLGAVERGGVLPHQVTELAGAIGTDDLLSGNRKRSRKMFVQSMSDPTGNSLAQGEWASPCFGSEIVHFSHLDTVPEAAEAKAFHLCRELKFSEVLAVCEDWADADPFLIRPYEFAAAAAALIDEYDQTIQFATRGLQLKRDAPLLLTAAAFALASSDRLNEAEAMLNRIPKVHSEAISHVASADRGLIAYRRGQHVEARRLYVEAIDGFKRIGMPRLGAQAQVYFAREAILAKEPDAEKLLQQARLAAKPFETSEVGTVLDRLEQRLGWKKKEPIGHSQPGSQREIAWSTPGLPAQFQVNVLGNGVAPETKRSKGADN